MKIIGLAAVAALVTSVGAHATPVTIVNASFETQGPGGLPFGCAISCNFSTDNIIPGWTATGSSGLFMPGPPSNTRYFNYVPDGVTVAYSNGGSITQTLAATTVAGTTYTFNIDFGFRKDVANPGSATLVIGTNTINATGTALPTTGNWSTYTATYTATAADAGAPISINLFTAGAQGDWDNARLDAKAVPAPEPASIALAGLGVLGLALSRRRRSR